MKVFTNQIFEENSKKMKTANLKKSKVPPKIMTPYNRITNERPA